MNPEPLIPSPYTLKAVKGTGKAAGKSAAAAAAVGGGLEVHARVDKPRGKRDPRNIASQPYTSLPQPYLMTDQPLALNPKPQPPKL